MKKPCMQCGASFDAKYDYHRLCWGCWKKNNPSAMTSIAEFNLEKSRLLDEIEHWKDIADLYEHLFHEANLSIKRLWEKMTNWADLKK